MMSQSANLPNDPYLAAQQAPTPLEPLKVDPQYHSIRLVTPIGRVAGCTLDKPRAPVAGGKVNFYLRLLFNPASVDGNQPDLKQAIYDVVTARFQPEQRLDPQTQQPRVYTAWELFSLEEKNGGLWYPLQDGNILYGKDPQRNAHCRNTMYINATADEKRKSGESNQPVCVDENGTPINADRIYLGCYARAIVTVFSYPKPDVRDARGRGIGIGLQSVQFARHGERIITFDAQSAARIGFANAGAIPKDPNAPAGPVGGPVPPAPGVPAGFAPPAAPIPPGMPAAGAYVPEVVTRPQQPWSPPGR